MTQLDLENTALAKGADTNNDLDIGDEDKNLDVQGLVDKIIRLKGMLKQANDRSEKPINIDGIQFMYFQLFIEQNGIKGKCILIRLKTILFTELLTSEGLVPEADLHKQCKEDYHQVKEEFERYKLRAQSVLKNKTSKVLEAMSYSVLTLYYVLQALPTSPSTPLVKNFYCISTKKKH